ncbi:hypothetical protein ACFQ4Q_08165 [Lysobacter gummosus]
MYAQRLYFLERHFIESGRASQVAAPPLMSTDRHAVQVAPAVRMERGRVSAAVVERVAKSAPSRAGRVLFGLHPLRARAGAPA